MERRTKRPKTPAGSGARPAPGRSKAPAAPRKTATTERRRPPVASAGRPKAVAGRKPRTATTSRENAQAVEGIRLHVLLARAGVASRREAERLIAAGEVQVNGRTVTEAGARAREGIDHVRVSGRLLHGAQKLRYYAYHKPVGCVSTLRDPEGRFCIGDVVAALGVRGLHPVGRLDFHSSGLLLLTNDGALTERLTHPRFHVEKRYAVKVNPRLSVAAVEALRTGVKLRGIRTAPAYVRELRHGDGKGWLDVRIVEGRNQQIRRMCEAVGSRVEKLRREAIGPLSLGDLEVGDARRLTVAEVEALREAAATAEASRSAAGTKKRGRSAPVHRGDR